MELSALDQAIYIYLQGDLPLCTRPYKELAERLQLPEESIIERIRELQAAGKIRRLSAVLRHREAGYQANAMVVWQAEPERIDRCGELLAGHAAVSHCYLRAVTEEFPWPLYTMVHARSEAALTAAVEELAQLSGLDEYQIIRSVREFKKSSMRFDQQQEQTKEE